MSDIIDIIRDNDTYLLTYMIEAGVNIDEPNDRGESPLIEATHSYELVEIMLNANAEPNVVDKRGHTALMWAAFKGNLEVCGLLIDKGAQVNMQDDSGYTALTWAVFGKKINVIQLLLHEHANAELVDKAGYTIIELAQQEGYDEIAGLLTLHVAKNNFKFGLRI